MVDHLSTGTFSDSRMVHFEAPFKRIIVGVVATAAAALTTHSDLGCLGFMSKAATQFPPLVGRCPALSRKKRAVHEKLDQFLHIKMPDAQNNYCRKMEVVLRSQANGTSQKIF